MTPEQRRGIHNAIRWRPTRRGNAYSVDSGWGADGEDGIRRAVRERVTHGVDVIKIMATGGNMTPTFGPHESQ